MKKAMTLLSVVMVPLLVHAQSFAQEQAEQTSKEVDVKITTTSVVEQTVDWGYDEKDGRSRVGMTGTKVPGKTMALKSTTEITKTIQLGQPTQHEVKCETDIDLEYYQKDTIAEVRTLVSAQNCESFDAAYQLRVVYFDENGKLQRIVADEEWPSGRAAAQHTTTYDMAPNARLHQITSRSVSCVCADGEEP